MTTDNDDIARLADQPLSPARPQLGPQLAVQIQFNEHKVPPHMPLPRLREVPDS